MADKRDEILERMDIPKEHWHSAKMMAVILSFDADALQVELEDAFNLGIGYLDWNDVNELASIS